MLVNTEEFMDHSREFLRGADIQENRSSGWSPWEVLTGRGMSTTVGSTLTVEGEGGAFALSPFHTQQASVPAPGRFSRSGKGERRGCDTGEEACFTYAASEAPRASAGSDVHRR
jgi:hypothetical protein